MSRRPLTGAPATSAPASRSRTWSSMRWGGAGNLVADLAADLAVDLKGIFSLPIFSCSGRLWPGLAFWGGWGTPWRRFCLCRGSTLCSALQGGIESGLPAWGGALGQPARCTLHAHPRPGRALPPQVPVRCFTADASSALAPGRRGTFLGLADKVGGRAHTSLGAWVMVKKARRGSGLLGWPPARPRVPMSRPHRRTGARAVGGHGDTVHARAAPLSPCPHAACEHPCAIAALRCAAP